MRHDRQVRRARRDARRADARDEAGRGRPLKRSQTHMEIAKGARKTPSQFARIEDALDAFRRGEMLIVVDDEDRENEGDLTIAAEKVTPDAINFMARYGR